MNSSTWRAPFYLFAAVNVLCFVGGFLSIDEDPPHPKDDKKVDWFGAFLVTAGLVMILFVLGDGESAPKQWATGCKHSSVSLFKMNSLWVIYLGRYHRPLDRWCIFGWGVSVLAVVPRKGSNRTTNTWIRGYRGGGWATHPQEMESKTSTARYENLVMGPRIGKVLGDDGDCFCHLVVVHRLDILDTG